MKNKQTRRKFCLTVMLMMVWALSTTAGVDREVKYFNNGKQISQSDFIRNGNNGTRTIYEKGIKRAETEFKSGKMSGLATTYFPDGKRKSQSSYRNDQKHGQYLEWYPNGQKMTEGKYENGKKQGRWLKWDKQANLLFEEFWKKGKVVLIKDRIQKTERSFIYHPNGQTHYEREYRGHLKHGKWIRWDSKGNKVYQREFRDGMRHGRWIEWNARGDIISDTYWELGKKKENQ